MTTIIVQECDHQIRRAPACEFFSDAEDGEEILAITVNQETTLILRREDAEDLHNALALHFAGL